MEHLAESDLPRWAGLLGANCRRLRLAAGMEFEQVAEATGLAKGYICNIEHNHQSRHHRTNPTLDVIVKLAAVYEVEPAELLLPGDDPVGHLASRQGTTKP